MLRFTRSKDGKPRATVRITHRCGFDDLSQACLLALDRAYAKVGTNDLREIAQGISRAAIERTLRREFAERGEGFHFAHESGELAYEGLIEEAYEVAYERVRALWPQLAETAR